MTQLANKKLEYPGLFTDREIGVVKSLINEAQRQWPCLKREDFDDLLQACLLKWWKVKPRYDKKAKASLSTYLATVVRHHLGNIKDSLLSDKRIISEMTVSLYQSTDDDEEYIDLLERIPAPDVFPALELKISIQTALPVLSGRQRELCRLLGEDGLSVADASRLMNVSEVTIYKDIKRIKVAFKTKNLHQYLHKQG